MGSLQQVESFVAGEWVGPGAGAREIAHAVTRQVFAEAGNRDLDFSAMLEFARSRGGPALRALSFHDRARMLKALAMYLNERKDQLYAASFATGATAADLFHAMDAILTGGAGGSDAGRYGHGVGMQLTEWPSLIPDDHTVAEVQP